MIATNELMTSSLSALPAESANQQCNNIKLPFLSSGNQNYKGNHKIFFLLSRNYDTSHLIQITRSHILL